MQTYEIDGEIAEIVRHKWSDSRERAIALAAYPAAGAVRDCVERIVNHLTKVATVGDIEAQQAEAEKAKEHAAKMHEEAQEAMRKAQAAKQQAEHFEGLAMRMVRARDDLKRGLSGHINSLCSFEGVSASALIGEDLAKVGFQVNDNSAHITEIDA